MSNNLKKVISLAKNIGRTQAKAIRELISEWTLSRNKKNIREIVHEWTEIGYKK